MKNITKTNLSLIAFLMMVIGVKAQAPTITSFSPTSGSVGTLVTITGTNFSATPINNIVFFGAVKAVVNTATTTTLVVVVPNGATYQPITVSTNNRICYSRLYFNVLFNGASAFTQSSFAPKIDSAVGTYPRGAVINDLDGDGKADIIVTNAVTNTLSVYRNTGAIGNISFAKRIDYSAGNNPNDQCTVGDLDGDGKSDVAICNFNSGNTSTLSIFRNTSTIGNISLEAKIDYPCGSGSLGAFMADFDGDGKLDIVLTSGNSGLVSVFRNITTSIGNISFASKIDYSFLNHPSETFVSDFDGDGKVDIAFTNFGSANVSILKNTSTSGNVSFNTAINFSVGLYPSFIAGADLNGDGKIDIIAENYGDKTVSILQNTTIGSTISFAIKQDFATIDNPSNISIGDLDGDGRPDMVVGSSTLGIIELYKNLTIGNGNISFDKSIQYTTGNYTTYTALGDFDGDGKLDISVSNSLTNNISILRNKINEPTILSFTPTNGFAGTTVTIKGINFLSATNVSFGGVSAASFSIIDSATIVAITAANTSGLVSITNQYGTGLLDGFNIFPPPIITSFSPITGPIGTTVAISGSNFNTNPASNIVYFGTVKAVVDAATPTQITVRVPLGSSQQSLTVTNNNLTGYCLQSPFIPTFNGGISAFDTGSFSTKIDSATGVGPWKIASGDIDGDGLSDIVVTNFTSGNVSIYLNKGSAGKISLSSPINYYTGLNVRGVALGDFDSDGKLDLAVTNSSTDNVSILRNISTIGSISFSNKIDFATNGHPEGITINDIDGDGKPDIILANYSSNTFSVFKNISKDGSVFFDSRKDFLTGNTPYNIIVVDINGDGKPEVCVNNISSNTISIFKNSSSSQAIAFSNKFDYSISGSPQNLVFSDVDGDGKQDMIVLNTVTNTVSVFKNLSSLNSISFSTKLDISTVSTPNGVAISDLNGDGKLDLAITYSNSNIVSIFKNTTNTNISFANATNYLTGSTAYSYPVNICISDLDGDGKPDLAVVNNGSNSISVLRNKIGELLPLNLITFIAQQQQNNVKLSWQTTNEVNTSYFIVQCSVDGTRFSNIGKIAAKGDSSYTFIDNQPSNSTLFYYRLQMVDKDGSYSYSKIVSCQLLVASKVLAIYPNPVKDHLFVQMTSTKAEILTLQITDLQGRLLQQEITQVSVGNVSLSVNTTALAKGSYVLLVKGSSGAQQKQFVKE